MNSQSITQQNPQQLNLKTLTQLQPLNLEQLDGVAGSTKGVVQVYFHVIDTTKL